ncbi:MAG TPA: lincomycin resistance protein LmrB [Propionibacteriaceae bacterium]
MSTSAGDVEQILQCLGQADVDARVVGGWGVDALVSRQTREHRDLDLAVAATDLDAALAALADLGFFVTTDWLPVRVELSDAERHVDLHPLHYRPDGSAWQAGPDDVPYEYPAGAWTCGVIGSTRVSCVTPELQHEYHSGYLPRAVDRHDLALLERLLQSGASAD